MKSFSMARPKTVAGAVAVAKGDFEDVKVLAGGTDLLALMKERVATPELLVNIKGVQGLSAIEKGERGLEIGALVTLDALARDRRIRETWPAIAETIDRSATPQVRNLATVAGNLAQRPRCLYFRHEGYACLKKGGSSCYAREGSHEHHAIFDNARCSAPHVSNLAPVLIAYGARLEIVGREATRTLDVEDFFVKPETDVRRENVLEPHEVITRIILPEEGARPRSAYVEARQKQSFDWALAGATVALDLVEGDRVVDARIVLNAVAPTPIRRRDLEDMLRGKKLTERLVDQVCEKAVADATPLRDNGYKTTMLKAVLRRAFGRAKEA